MTPHPISVPKRPLSTLPGKKIDRKEINAWGRLTSLHCDPVHHLEMRDFPATPPSGAPW